MAGDDKKVVRLYYATVTEELSFREFAAMVVDLASRMVILFALDKKSAIAIRSPNLTLSHIK